VRRLLADPAIVGPDCQGIGARAAPPAQTGNLDLRALVVAPVSVDGHDAGAVGLLGPTRMNYPQALAAAHVVGERLGERIGDALGGSGSEDRGAKRPRTPGTKGGRRGR